MQQLTECVQLHKAENSRQKEQQRNMSDAQIDVIDLALLLPIDAVLLMPVDIVFLIPVDMCAATRDHRRKQSRRTGALWPERMEPWR